LICGDSIHKVLTQNTGFRYGLIIPKSTGQIKADISTEKADIRPYGTIVMQAPQAQRVTVPNFLGKNRKKNECPAYFYYGKKRAVIETAIIL
jgi:hypothetical protein